MCDDDRVRPLEIRDSLTQMSRGQHLSAAKRVGRVDADDIDITLYTPDV